MTVRPRAQMQQDLSAAIRARDVVRVKALRSALAALSNAEAVDVSRVPCDTAPTRGVRMGDVVRRHLSDADVRLIVVDQIDELRADAAHYRELGHPGVADGLEAQAAVLEAYLR